MDARRLRNTFSIEETNIMDTARRSRVRRLKTSSACRHRQRPRFEVLENRRLLSMTSVTWTGDGDDDLWSDAANWSNDQVPGAGDDVTIDQSGNPTIQITSGSQVVDSLTSLDMISISGGSLLVAASSSLSGGLTMTGGSLTATGSGTVVAVSGTTTISAASLYAEGGASLSLPDLTCFSSNQSTFQADGAGSVLDVSGLTNVTQQGAWNIDATNGGTLNLSGLSSLTCTNIIAVTDTGGGTLNLSGLTSLTSTVSFGFGISMTDTGGSTLLDGHLTTLTADQLAGIVVTLDGSDAHVADSWNSFTDSNLNIVGGRYALPGLTDVDGSSLYVSNGGSLVVTGLACLDSNFSTFQSDGADSLLDVSALSNVTQQGPLWLNATNGGTLNLGGLTSLTSTQGVTITDTGGSTLLDGQLTNLDGVDVTSDGTDAQVANAWTALNGTFTLTGGSETLPNLTAANFSGLELDGGATLDLPATAGNFTNSGDLTLGAGSTLDIAGSLTLTSGGTVDEQIGGTPASGLFGQANIGGSTILAGNFNVDLLDGDTPAVGEAYPLFTSTQVTGAFDTLAGLGPFSNNATLTPVYNSTSLLLEATGPPVYWTGDAGDGDWDDPANWSFIDPLVNNVPESVLPSGDNVVVDLGDQTINHSQNLDDTIASLTVTGQDDTLNLSAGTLDLSGGGSLGTFEVDQPDDVVNLSGAILASAIVTSGTTITATSSGSTLNAVTLNGTLEAESGISVNIAGGLVLNGTVELGYDNKFAGDDSVSQTISGTGTIDLSGYDSTLENIGAGTLTIAPNITVQAGDTYSEIMASGGPIHNEGTIDDSNGYFLLVGDDSATDSFTNSGTVLIGIAATLQVYNSSESFYSETGGYAAYAQSAGSTTVDGSLTTVPSYYGGSGPVNIAGGLLDGSGTVDASTVTNAGTVDPGDGTGTLTIDGNLTQTAAGALDINLAGSTQYGQLAVTGTATLNGALNVATVNSFVPGPANQFIVLTFGRESGDFSATTGLGPYANGTELSANFTSGNLTLAPALPTLAITATQAPSSVVEGASIPLTWTVTNQSTTVPTSFSWTDLVYLSTKSVLDNTAVLLTTVAAPPQSPLGPEASYTTNVSAAVPGNLLPGSNYFLLIVVDANGKQAVTGASKLIVAAPITVTAADLGVSSATAPRSANLGDSIAVSWTVENTGNAAAASTWQDAVYLSSTDTLTPSSELLDEFAAPPAGPLAAQAGYTLNENVVIPLNAATGAEFLLFVPDANGGQVVSGSTIDSAAINVAAPQLTVQDLVVPGNSVVGQSFSVSWQVTNAGSAPLDQDWSDEVFVSSQSTLDSSATLLDTVPATNVIPLATDASYSRSVTVTVPLTVNSATGTFYVFVVADASDQLAIADRALATASKPIALNVPPLPDLTPGSLSAPTTGYNGQSVTVSWTDANNGNAAATGPWVDNIDLASDVQGDDATLVGQATYPSAVAAGQPTVPLTQPIYLPSTPGTYYLMVVADASGINEGPNALNDKTVDPTPITVVNEPLPDLVVTSITPPTNVVSGTTVPITYTVTNEGDSPTNAAQWQDAIFISQTPSLTLSPVNDLAYGVGAPLVMPVLVNNPSYLLAGQGYSQTVDVPFPVSASGTWYVYVATNRSFTHTPLDNFIDTGPVVESDSTNDMTISAPFSVTLAPLPALTVAPVQTPPAAFSGQPLTVTWTVSNQGPGIAIGQAIQDGAPLAPIAPTLPANSTWTDDVFMSPNPTLDSNAIALGTFTHTGALDSGAGYTESEQVTLPVGISGRFYFIVQTDINGQVFESGSTAHEVNATPTAITVNLTPPPDLRTSILSVPSTAQASHALTFSYQVNNIGAGPTALLNSSDVWTDSFYLSPTPTYDAATAISIGQESQNDSLDAGASYQNTVTVTLPNGLSGSYYLIVDADSGDAVFELNQTGKFGASAGAIQVSSDTADLVVTSVSAPTDGQAGDAIVVNWTVVNEGSGDTAVSSWQDDVYVDTSSTFDGNAVLLGSFTHTGLLKAGGSYNQSQLVTLPINLSGSYTIFVVTDQPVPPQDGEAAGAPPVYETDYANDVSTPFSVEVTQTLADLLATSVTAPTTAPAGSRVTIDWTVVNDGTGTTNSNDWFDDVWLSTETTLGGGGADYYLGSVQHSNPLAPHGNDSASLTVTVPASLAAGPYHFIVAVDRPVLPPGAEADTLNLVYESNEGDNETAAAVTSGANLVVSAVTAPGTLDMGQPLTVGWTVTNNGVAAPARSRSRTRFICPTIRFSATAASTSAP